MTVSRAAPPIREPAAQDHAEHHHEPAAHGDEPAARGCGESALTAALALCRNERIALTPGRRRILEILAREGRPLGAYDLIDRVAAETGKRPAPISIYRALDFLLENNLIHRLASRNAYLACGHGHARQAAIAFLICEACGEVVEADSGALRGSLAALTAEAHFSPRAQVMEVTGLCRACAGA
jgi:Fur family zinc uptake transcriptional regulator